VEEAAIPTAFQQVISNGASLWNSGNFEDFLQLYRSLAQQYSSTHPTLQTMFDLDTVWNLDLSQTKAYLLRYEFDDIISRGWDNVTGMMGTIHQAVQYAIAHWETDPEGVLRRYIQVAEAYHAAGGRSAGSEWIGNVVNNQALDKVMNLGWGYRLAVDRIMDQRVTAATLFQGETKEQRYTVRVFDLGGSGLKTALADFSHDGLPVLGPVRNLGKVPVGKDVYKWVREKIPTFSAEKNSGEFKFGASLAGLDKLWEDKQVHERGTFEQLVRADAIHHGPGVKVLSDGKAHLIASKHMVPQVAYMYPLCNIALGTGIAINLTNSHGEIRIGDEMTQFFGRKDHWNFPVECEGREKPMYEAFGGNFDGARGNTARQTARWVRFIEGRLAERFTVMGWTLPVCCTFTGGVAEKSSLVAKLQEHFAQGLPIYKGPDNAGLLGAALHSINSN